MAYREVTVFEVKEVLRLWLRGRSRKAVARIAGVSRNTVRGYIREAERCGVSRLDGEGALTEEKLTEILVQLKTRPARSKGESWARCRSQGEFVGKKLEDGLKLSKVHRLLERRGVKVPYATLHRYAVSELGFGGTSLTIPVADCAAGEEIQLDTGWMGYLEPDLFGKRRRFRAWIFTAVRSRHRYVHPCFRESTAAAIEACESAWEFFGGIFRVLIPDNTKAIVHRYDPLTPLINATFLEYAQKRGFEIDPTRRRRPRDKARVERAVIPTRDDCFAGEHLFDLEGAQRRAQAWCLREYGMRRHNSTQRLPLEHFEAEERAALRPAPSEPYETPRWSDAKVHRDQHVVVEKALYSLPVAFESRRLIGRTLRARCDSRTVRFYLEGLLVKTHQRLPPGGRSTDPADFPAEKLAYANRDSEFLERQARDHGESVGLFAHRLLSGPLPWTKLRRAYALLGLCKRYGSSRVDEACGVALAADMIDVRRLERMLELAGRSATAGPRPSNLVPIARYLRPRQQYSLPLTNAQTRKEEEEDHES